MAKTVYSLDGVTVYRFLWDYLRNTCRRNSPKTKLPAGRKSGAGSCVFKPDVAASG